MAEDTVTNKETRTSKFLKNSFSTFIYQAVLLVVGFITPRLMLTYYGSEINGLVTSLAQFVSYLTLVEAGISASTIYSLYKPLADKDEEGISSIVVASKNFYYKSGFLFLALIIVLAFIYPLFVEMPNGLNYLDVVLLAFISGFSGIVDFFTLAKYRSILTADQKTYIISISTTCYTISNLLIFVCLALFKTNIVIVKAVCLLSVVLRSIILIIYCKKKYPYINYNAKPDNSALDKRWDALFQQVLGMVQNGAPIIILTFVCRDLSVVSIFTIFNMVLQGVNSLLSIFISG